MRRDWHLLELNIGKRLAMKSYFMKSLLFFASMLSTWHFSVSRLSLPVLTKKELLYGLTLMKYRFSIIAVCRSDKILQKSTIRQLISYFCTFWQKYSIEYMKSYCESVSGSGIKTKYADLLVEFRHNGRGFLLSLSLITPYSIHHYWI